MKIFILLVALTATVNADICSMTWETLTGDANLFPSSSGPQDCETIFGQLTSILSNPLQLSNLYKQYKTIYNKNSIRSNMANFATTMLKIAKSNIEFIMGGQPTYLSGVNKFTDMTEEELKKYRGDFTADPSLFTLPTLPIPGFRALTPESHDWRTQNIVSAVKNQGQCGSCWAFGTIAMFESAVAKKTGKLQVLSEQELVDCVPYASGGGCNGGNVQAGLKYIKESGVTLASNYQYTGVKAACSNSTKTKIANRVVSIGAIATKNEQAMMDAIYTYGPIGTSAVVGDAWSYYKSGIFNGECGTGGHAMNTVGYGVENGQKYWIVRNSWGADWGEKGFIRVIRGVDKCTLESRNLAYTTVS